MFKFVLLPLVLIYLCEQGQAQERFVVTVTEYVSGKLNEAVGRCSGTIITDRVNFDFGGGLSGSTDVPAERAFIHPDYKQDNYTNNVAVVLLAGQFNSTALPPRRLGSIPLHSPTCTLFGFGGAALFPETVNVVLHAPENCYPNQTQTYCSEHVPLTRACSSRVGSPLVCNPARSVDAILLETGCQEESPGRYLLPYHSVHEFRDWIELVSGAELVNQISTVLLLSALVIGLRDLV